MRKIFPIEVLRVICAISVVVDHVAIAAINMYESTSSDMDKFVYYGLQHWSHFAVPVFVMISGFLLLDPDREIGYDKAIKKYAKRMGVVLLVVGTAFAFIEILFETNKISFWNVGRAFLHVFENKGWKHMWYLYMMIGIYLVLPILKSAYNSISQKTFLIFLVLMFLFTSVIPIVSSYTGIDCGIQFPIMSIYLFYFFLGRWVFDNRFCFNSIVLYAVTLLLMFAPIGVSYLEHFRGLHELVLLTNYSSPLIVVISVLISWSVMGLRGGQSVKLRCGAFG